MKIVSSEWGSVTVENTKADPTHLARATYKDCIIGPTITKEWDWKVTGTRHVPGIQPTNIDELIADGAEVIILALGFEGKLHVSDYAIAYLLANKIPFYSAFTPEAVKLFNRLSGEGLKVGGLFHSTC